MKKIFFILSALVFTFASCINDVENINPQQTTELDADALFNKIYATFVLTGQKGPSDNGDLINMDEGRSQYTRMIWNLNELTTDESHWYWYKNDAGYEDLVQNTYNADNAVSQGFFYRAYFNITLCNLYLSYVEDDGTAETKARRAEVRFIRVMNYYSIMDLFGNGPFSDEFVMGQSGEYYTRVDFYNFIEKELKALETELKAEGTNTYGRVDQMAAKLMLSRLYLNAEVYTGQAQWQLAKDYAQKVINSNYYKLMTTDATNPVTGEYYSPYQMLFLADNDKTDAKYEDLFPILHNGETTQSYGGMHALILSCYSPNMSTVVPSGTDNNWGKCATIRGKLVDIFFGPATSSEPVINSINSAVSYANDDRALLLNTCGEDTYKRVITTQGEQTEGYCCVKFRNVRSDGAPTTTTNGYVDTDWPYLRIAEAYLNYAEADARMNNGVTSVDGGTMLNVLRARAHASTIKTSYSLDELRDEWAKEFWFEGRRRMDLVRFNSFGGQSEYKWEWMGGAANGNQFAATRNVFGIPSAEITNNPAIKQNAGY
ncbi:MAG: RagB/SusD family nutrient uptake outer membrane protein [Prevotellaceae bacterium]|nr:RagB/SusD family nutrient uptake outer membrane protein [Prevotellaceae bacterium]